MSIVMLRQGLMAASFRPPPFPTTLPGLEHWCDFSGLGLPDNTPIAQAGQYGPQWAQGTAGARFTYRTGANGLNGRGAAVADGDDWMSFPVTSGIRLFATAGIEWTVAIVGQYVRDDSGIILYRGGAAGSLRTFRIVNSAGAGGAIIGNLRGSPNQNLVGDLGDDAAARLIIVTWDGSTARFYLDDGSAVTMDVGESDEVGDVITLGARFDGSNPMRAGSKVGETIVCSTALEGTHAAKRAELVAYAASKWGVGA